MYHFHMMYYHCIFTTSAKTAVYMKAAPTGKEPGPAFSSPNNHIKLSFRSGGQSEVGLLVLSLKRVFSPLG